MADGLAISILVCCCLICTISIFLALNYCAFCKKPKVKTVVAIDVAQEIQNEIIPVAEPVV